MPSNKDKIQAVFFIATALEDDLAYLIKDPEEQENVRKQLKAIRNIAENINNPSVIKLTPESINFIEGYKDAE